jgi:hypothetical protein
MADIIPQGAFGLNIKYSAEAIRRFTQLERNVLSYNDLTQIWESVIPLIRENIKNNLNFGVEPDGMPWAPLRQAYSEMVGRPNMIISPISPIYQSYVLAPTIILQPMRLIYSASPIASDDNHPPFYDIALREGFIAGGFAAGTPIVGREWFGISDRTKDSIDRLVGYRIQNKIGENIS